MSPSLKKFAERAISSNTQLSYEKALGRIQDWLRVRKLELNDSSLAEYLVSIYEAGSSHATCSLCVAAVRWMARETSTAELAGNTTILVLKGIARSRKRGPGQVDGLDWNDVVKVVDIQHSKKTLEGFRNAAMIAVGSDAMLRVSEIQVVAVEDVELNVNDKGFSVLTIPRSKTDQEGIGEKRCWVHQRQLSWKLG